MIDIFTLAIFGCVKIKDKNNCFEILLIIY